MGVHVCAEPHPERLDERGNVLTGKMPGAIEAHVLDEMGQPTLVVVFEHGAGVHHEPQFGATSGLRVRPDEVLQTVGQPADADLWVDGDNLGERGLLRLAGRRPRLAHGQGGGSCQGGEREDRAAHTRKHEHQPTPSVSGAPLLRAGCLSFRRDLPAGNSPRERTEGFAGGLPEPSARHIDHSLYQSLEPRANCFLYTRVSTVPAPVTMARSSAPSSSITKSRSAVLPKGNT